MALIIYFRRFCSILAFDVPFVLSGVANSNLLNVCFRDFLRFFQCGVNGEFGADNGAKATVAAVLRLRYDFRRMIALDVEALTLLQTTVGTEFNTEAAPLATIVNYVDCTPRYGMYLRIQRQTPKSHAVSPPGSITALIIISISPIVKCGTDNSTGDVSRGTR